MIKTSPQAIRQLLLTTYASNPATIHGNCGAGKIFTMTFSSGILSSENNLPCDEQSVYCSQCSCDELLCKHNKFNCKPINSISKVTNSTTNGMNCKGANSTANTPERMVPGIPFIVPIINYALNSVVVIMLHFYIAMLCSLHSTTNKEQCNKLLYNESRHYGTKHDKARGKLYCTITNWHLAKTLEHKGELRNYDMWFVWWKGIYLMTKKSNSDKSIVSSIILA